jgi:hypothetical protein
MMALMTEGGASLAEAEAPLLVRDADDYRLRAVQFGGVLRPDRQRDDFDRLMRLMVPALSHGRLRAAALTPRRRRP